MVALCLRYDVPGNCGRRLTATTEELWSGEPCQHCDRPVRKQPPSALLAPAKREAARRIVEKYREEYDRMVLDIVEERPHGR